jgi:CRISPR-associated protein Cas1
MKKLLNTLYVTIPEAYLALDGETVLVLKEEEKLIQVPLHNLEGIVTFGYTGASPALMGACAKNNISLCFLTANGRFLARVVGESYGNVILRKTQYRVSDNEEQSALIAKNFIIGKTYNSKWVIERAMRDHPLVLDMEHMKEVSGYLSEMLEELKSVTNLEEIRGLEGKAANIYFSAFDALILQQKEYFFWRGRSRRPPMDNVNALLSFVYTLLANDCSSALEAVGLDAYVGFLHRDRPGRVSLALDLMEELRSVLADRFVITLINKRVVTSKGFYKRENGSVIMDDDTRKTVLVAWQERKREQLTHPFLNEKVMWGLVPHIQAMLLARYLRGDLDVYPPFLWK